MELDYMEMQLRLMEVEIIFDQVMIMFHLLLGD